MFEDCKKISNQLENDTDCILLNHWTKEDIFSDNKNVGHHTLLFKVEKDCEYEIAQDRLLDILDLRYKVSKRAFITSDIQNIRIGINIHIVQDFLVIKPILDVIDSDQVVLFLRNLFFLKPDELSLIRGYFKKRGILIKEYRLTEEISWNEFNIDILISASESPVWEGHILSMRLIEYAKLNSIHTILLQHGIWIEPFNINSVPFASHHLLTWGD